MKRYLVTLIHGDVRTLRNVIAASSMQAMCIGIKTMSDTHEPCRIICKPAEAL